MYSHNILFDDAAPLGLDVLYSATIGNHLTVGNNIIVGGTGLIGRLTFNDLTISKSGGPGAITFGTTVDIPLLNVDNIRINGNPISLKNL
ncbi:hypothetical protein LCGC14_1100180 [marine sediment metagenome]|uniref:Uncharacterized protein n=1 Tax=marine sediment metagenome TaxID=412755 RepID=A0A0F9MXI5_9ZZZZ